MAMIAPFDLQDRSSIDGFHILSSLMVRADTRWVLNGSTASEFGDEDDCMISYGERVGCV
jgi:hypothetical protein